MKKELQYILYIFIGFITLLWFAKPLREYLITYDIAELNSGLLARIIVRLFIIPLIFLVIWKLKLKRYNSLEKSRKIENLQSLLIPFLFILIGLTSNWNTYINVDLNILFLFLASVFIVGFAEELLFRGIILPIFIKYFKSQKNVLFLSVILSSSIFGMIHYVNILKEPDNFWGITHQVFFALSIGVFFGGLMLRTKNILIPSIFHGFVNFSFGAGELKQNEMKIINENITEGIDWNSIIPTTLLFAFIFLAGIYMTNKVDKEVILNKLN
ncbi:MAG: CPBP family intramembrane metalloprotease [Bacteroidales bacterium]|jgi:membrane protease YdiL (CAAX protease family)|nr:CPBP family intramembrane metalloprotease [Bacteroidales bacterium]